MVAEVDNTKKTDHTSSTSSSTSEIPFQFTDGGLMSTAVILALETLLNSVSEMENKNRQAQASFVNDQASSVRDASSATEQAGQAALDYSIGAGVSAIAGAVVGGAMTLSGAAEVSKVNTSDEDSTITGNKSMLKELDGTDFGESIIGDVSEDNSEGTPEAKLTACDMEDNLDNLLQMLESGSASKEDLSSAIDGVKKANFQFDQAKTQEAATDSDGTEIEGTSRAASLENAFGSDPDDDRTAYEKKQAVSEKVDKVKDILNDGIKEAQSQKGEKLSAAKSKQQGLTQIQNTVVTPLAGALQGMLQGGGQAAQATLNAAASTANSTADIFKSVASTFGDETQKMAKLLSDLYQVIGNISRSAASIGGKLS